MMPNPLQNGQMPAGLAEALRQAQAQHPAQPQPSPLDTSNGLLAPVEVRMNLRRQDIEDPALTVPANCSAVPAEAVDQSGTKTKVVIFTIRTVCQTFSAFWNREITRANIDWIRSFLSEEMPVILMPPGSTAGPDLRRMVLSLEFEGTNGGSGEVEVELDATHAADWADLLERALFALTGLTLPGQ